MLQKLPKCFLSHSLVLVEAARQTGGPVPCNAVPTSALIGIEGQHANGKRMTAKGDRAQTRREWVLAALDQFEDSCPDVVILDIGIPKITGLELCQHLRTTSDVPVIMVTSMGSDEDVVRGLEAGADDYLSKPFNSSVLRARVQAVMRRRMPGGESLDDHFIHNGLEVDFERREVRLNGQAVHLTPIEYSLLSLMIQYRGKVLTSSHLLGAIWGPEYELEGQILRTHMSRLRRKIDGNLAQGGLIVTEPGVGYRLDA